MPGRKKSAKIQPSSAKGWDRPILAAPVSDDEWSCFLTVCKADGDVSQSFLAEMGPEIEKGTRQKFLHISQLTLMQWAKDQVKVKTKSKEPFDLAVAEACQLAVNNADSPDGIPPAVLARVVKCKISLHRRAEVARMAEELAMRKSSSASLTETKSAKAPKSAKGKKGKGGGGDGPGKKATTMVKRADEKTQSADDEPENSPTAYYVLEGFDKAEFIQEMSVCKVAIGVIIRTRAANVAGDKAYAEPPPEEQEDAEENHRRLDDYEAVVRGFALESPTGSTLRNLSWLDLPVGVLGMVDPNEIFDEIAKLTYLTLERQEEYHDYLESLDKNTIPVLGEADWSTVASTYRTLVDAVPVDRCGVAAVLDCMLQAVAVAAGDPASSDEEEDAAAAMVHQSNDGASIATIGLKPDVRNAALAAGRRIAAASVGGAYCHFVEASRKVRADTELHRLRSASTLTALDTDFAWRQLQLEKLLQVDLTDWSVIESHGSTTLCQALGAALREYHDVRVMEDTLHDSKLIAILNDNSVNARRQQDWNIRCASFVDFTNFRDHVVAALESEGDATNDHTIGYDIGDILLDVSGTEDTWVAPSAGQIADDSMRLKMGASYTRRTFRVCGTTLTQHFNPDTDTDECEQMVAALSDGSFATMERAVDVPEESAEEASSPASDAPEVVPADSDGERSATASPPFYDGGLKRNVTAVMTVGTPAGLQASILADGAVRQRLLDSSLPRVGRHLDLGSIACEISRTYLSDGSVVRCFYSRSLEILTASGTLHRRNKAGDWTTVSADGKRSMTSASGETSELEALRITTRTDPVTKSVVRTRSDKVVMVANSDGSSSVEYPDGSRMYTAPPTSTDFCFRIECLGMGRVSWSALGVEVLLPTGTRVSHRGEEKRTALVQPDGTEITFDSNGTGVIRGTVGDGFEFGFTKRDAIVASGENNAADGDALSSPQQLAPHAFRLFEIKQDGTGHEVLNATRVAAYAKVFSSDPTSRVIENPVAGCAGARSVAYVRTTTLENAFLAAYSETSMLPTALQRSAVPYALESTTQSMPAQIMRELVYNEPLAGPRRDNFTAEIAAFMVAAETMIPAEVVDERLPEEVAAATLLAESVLSDKPVQLNEEEAETLRCHAEVVAPPPAVATVKESSTVALHDSIHEGCFLEAFRKLTAPPPRPPRGMDLIDPAMLTFDDWFKDGRTSQSLDLQLASTTIPKYWNSEDYRMFIHKDGPLKEEKPQSVVNVEGTASPQGEVLTSDNRASSTDMAAQGEVSSDSRPPTTEMPPPGSKYNVLPPIEAPPKEANALNVTARLSETLRLEQIPPASS